jgi:Anaphase-promoting complex APC subunit CDC26
MLSRKPTAIKLTHEDIQHLDNVLEAQQYKHTSAEEVQKTDKGKEVASTHDRQQSRDARIGVTTGTRTVRR